MTRKSIATVLVTDVLTLLYSSFRDRPRTQL